MEKRGLLIIIIMVAAFFYFSGNSGNGFNVRSYLPKSLQPSAQIPYEAVVYLGHHYHVYHGVCKSWEDARMFCEDVGGHLAVIDNEDENGKIYKIMRDSGFKTAYFGFSNANPQNIWEWTNNSDVKFTSWSAGEPKSLPDFNYARFMENSKGLWCTSSFYKDEEINSSEGIAFICEWDE